MKSTKLLIALLMVALLSGISYAQPDQQVNGFSVIQKLGTQADGTGATEETFYLDLRGWKSVDSVTVAVSASGEIDVDTVNFYIGNWTQDGFIADAAAGVLYQAITINLADGVTDFELLVTGNATVLTGVALRGANGIKAEVEVDFTGNDATDTDQGLWFHWKVHGTK